MLDHIIREAICEDLPRQGRNGHARTLALEDISEVLEVGVAAAHDRVSQLEGRDVGACVDLVGGVHSPGRGAVGLWVLHLMGS